MKPIQVIFPKIFKMPNGLYNDLVKSTIFHQQSTIENMIHDIIRIINMASKSALTADKLIHLKKILAN